MQDCSGTVIRERPHSHHQTLGANSSEEFLLLHESRPSIPWCAEYGDSDEEYEQRKELRKHFKGLPLSKTPYAISQGTLRKEEMNGFCSSGQWRSAQVFAVYYKH